MTEEQAKYEAKPNKPVTSITEDCSTLYCPTCGNPRADIKESDATTEVFTTFYCLNCGKALGTGILLNLKVLCSKCDMSVVVG